MGGRSGKTRRKSEKVLWSLDLHLPVFSTGPSGIQKPLIYGTAFPIAPGLFATAGHVLRSAQADGRPVLSVVPGAGKPMGHHELTAAALFLQIDFALLQCPSLDYLTPIPIDFDRTLDLLTPASAIGFPTAVDAEYVRCVARGFSGSVVTRRQLLHLSGHPPGYELSFFAPPGLSGAPLVSMVYGVPRCYGYMIQQSTIGSGTQETPVGIAVSIEVLLGIKCDFLEQPLAELFGREFVPPRLPMAKQLPDGQPVVDHEQDNWPDAEIAEPNGED